MLLKSLVSGIIIAHLFAIIAGSEIFISGGNEMASPDPKIKSCLRVNQGRAAIDYCLIIALVVFSLIASSPGIARAIQLCFSKAIGSLSAAGGASHYQ
jgi:hypothetical protein